MYPQQDGIYGGEWSVCNNVENFSGNRENAQKTLTFGKDALQQPCETGTRLLWWMVFRGACICLVFVYPALYFIVTI